MRVALTGATGFLGGHTLVALRAAGHEPVALVRNADKLATVEQMHGLDAVDHVVGDVTDEASVASALAGADAVIHAAAVAHIGRKHREEVKATNVRATELVLETAAAAGLDPIVHVSSNSALHPPPSGTYTPESPLSTAPVGAYAASKVASERIARRLQAEGAPIVIVWPSGIMGPDDVGLSVGASGTAKLMEAGVLPDTSAGSLIVDVRDVAAVLAASCVAELGPRRYGAFGHFLTWREMADLIDEVSGSKLKTPKMPGGLMRTLAWGGELAAMAGFEPTLDRTSAIFMTTMPDGDDASTARELGVVWRPIADTMRDMLAWLVSAGHLEAKHVPALG